jgi:hypothetical protein
MYEPTDQRQRVNFSPSNNDGCYRITGWCLNFLVRQKGQEIIKKLAAILCEGRFYEESEPPLA